MNIERLLRMILRFGGRRAIGKGLDMATRRGKSPDEITPEEKVQARQARRAAKRARQAAKLARRTLR